MYVIGIRTPYSMKKIARQRRVKLILRNTVKSGRREAGLSRGGKRERMRILDGTERPSRMNPTTRALQAKPTLGMRDRSRIGKRTPPIPPAVVARPVASPLRASKKCAIAPSAGLLRRAPPSPPTPANARMI